jgi:RND family efflux transporter MFP subunit
MSDASAKGGATAHGPLFGLVATLVAAVVACFCGYILWQSYMGTPWTRDGTVRAYIVTMAPDVSGRVIELPLVDNQLVHKGDLLMKIDPRDYQAAFDAAKAAVDVAKADLDNKRAESARRAQLTDLATTAEEKESYASSAAMAAATVEQRQAELEQARVNLERVDIHSPVNGWITNLQTRVGDYAEKGTRSLTIVDADSYWVDGYFEETIVGPIREGDPARVRLLGYKPVLTGHVDSLSRGITVANAAAGPAGLADVNPVFTWVRLAQRVPVRVHLDPLPEGVRLVAGMTASVEILTRATP